MKKKLASLLAHIELIIFSFVVLCPMVLVVLSSFSNEKNLESSPLIPTTFTLDNYVRLVKETDYVLWFFNTLKIAVVTTVVSVFVVMITAWIMSRFNFKGKKTSLITILLLSMFPTFLSMTAIYTLFSLVGLIGSPYSLIIVYVAGAIPYNAWLVKGYLDRIPRSLDEAAYMDGCTRFQTFFKIILPLSTPIITYCAVNQFLMPWMDYVLPSMFLTKSAQKTLAVGLYGLIAESQKAQSTLFAAGAVLVAVPITLLFLAFQKFLVQGIAAGADKG